MRVGMTYDLRREYLEAGYGEEETAEFDQDSTIDALEGALRRLGHDVDRIGRARRLVERLSHGDRWDLVFNIAEGLRGIGREAQVPAILELYEIPYTFSDPMVMSLTLHKAMTKRVIRDAGLPTPDFAVVEDPSEAAVDFPGPWFVKPLAEGTGKGVTPESIARSPAALREACRRLLKTFNQAVLVERFLPGREFTVGIAGTGKRASVLGTLEVVLKPQAEQGVYSYANKENSEELVEYPFVRPDRDETVRRAEAVALESWKVLGCRDAGRVDLRADDAGRPQFIEVNPLAGLHPTHSDLPMICTAAGIPYDELIGAIVSSAMERAPRELPVEG